MKKTVCLFVAIFCLCLSGYAQDTNADGRIDILDTVAPKQGGSFDAPGQRSGAILVDTGHGEYMTTASCSILFSNLAGQGYTATDFSGTIDAAALAGYDVLCIGTPRGNSGASFTNTEISAIVAFVQQGGGLMISGDYYNPPYSDNVKANSVVNNFGITYNQDSGTPTWPTITSFTSHPINQGISSIGYYGWCTSTLSGSAQSIADYTGIGVVEVVEHGAGRVFSLHDWNIYSDGYINDYQNLAFMTQGIVWASQGAGTPSVDIKCNGADAGVMVPTGTNARLDFDVVAATAVGTPVDIWLVIVSPFGPFSYNGVGPIAGWNFGLGFAYFTGPLADVSGTCLDQPVPLGSYKAFCGLDTLANGSLDLGSVVLKDKVDFTVF